MWRPKAAKAGAKRTARAGVFYDMLQLKDVHPDNPLFAFFVKNAVGNAEYPVSFPGGAVPPLFDAPVTEPEEERWEDVYQ